MRRDPAHGWGCSLDALDAHLSDPIPRCPAGTRDETADVDARSATLVDVRAVPIVRCSDLPRSLAFSTEVLDFTACPETGGAP